MPLQCPKKWLLPANKRKPDHALSLFCVLPQNIQHIFYALAQFVAAIFCGFCTWAGWEATQLVIQTSQKSIAMLMPMWIVYISVPLGCLLMAIRFLVAGINYLRNTNNSSLILDEEGNVDLNKL